MAFRLISRGVEGENFNGDGFHRACFYSFPAAKDPDARSRRGAAATSSTTCAASRAATLGPRQRRPPALRAARDARLPPFVGHRGRSRRGLDDAALDSTFARRTPRALLLPADGDADAPRSRNGARGGRRWRRAGAAAPRRGAIGPAHKTENMLPPPRAASARSQARVGRVRAARFAPSNRGPGETAPAAFSPKGAAGRGIATRRRAAARPTRRRRHARRLMPSRHAPAPLARRSAPPFPGIRGGAGDTTGGAPASSAAACARPQRGGGFRRRRQRGGCPPSPGGVVLGVERRVRRTAAFRRGRDGRPARPRRRDRGRLWRRRRWH